MKVECVDRMKQSGNLLQLPTITNLPEPNDTLTVPGGKSGSISADRQGKERGRVGSDAISDGGLRSRAIPSDHAADLICRHDP